MTQPSCAAQDPRRGRCVITAGVEHPEHRYDRDAAALGIAMARLSTHPGLPEEARGETATR